MHQFEIWDTINAATRDALLEGLHTYGEHQLMRRADELLRRLPVVDGAPPTAALLLRRYRWQLQQHLCINREPRFHYDVVEDEVRDLTRIVMLTIALSEGISVEVAVLLGLAIRAEGLDTFCEIPASIAA